MQILETAPSFYPTACQAVSSPSEELLDVLPASTSGTPAPRFWTGLDESCLPDSRQHVESIEQLSWLHFPADLWYSHSTAYDSAALLSPSGVQLPLQLQQNSIVSADAAPLEITTSSHSEDLQPCYVGPPESVSSNQLQQAAALQAVVPHMVGTVRQQHAQVCSRQGTSALQVTSLNKSVELEPEAGFGGNGWDGCGENGGEGGGASW